ncbi:MAG: hypothetical protein ABDH20_13215 [Thermus sp.]
MTWVPPVREKVLAQVPEAGPDLETRLMGSLLEVSWGGEVRALLDYPTVTLLSEEEVARLEALPLPPAPVCESEGPAERSLEERVDYALARYRGFYRNEAPRTFREAYPEEPTPEGVLALGRLRGYWEPEEEAEAARLIEAHLGARA